MEKQIKILTHANIQVSFFAFFYKFQDQLFWINNWLKSSDLQSCFDLQSHFLNTNSLIILRFQFGDSSLNYCPCLSCVISGIEKYLIFFLEISQQLLSRSSEKEDILQKSLVVWHPGVWV